MEELSEEVMPEDPSAEEFEEMVSSRANIMNNVNKEVKLQN